MGLIENIRKRGLKDITNPKKWDVVAEFNTMKKHGLTIEVDEIIPFCEQIVYRTQMCPECLERGSCVGCGCDMPDSMITPSNWCSEGKWLSYMPPNEWEKYKEKYGIVFSAMHIKGV